jgi:KaiC/GvpD/RAD55 family RecA-like ATPase
MVLPQERRTVVFDLASVLSAYQCTTFLIGEYGEGMMTALPEFAIADVVLQLIKQMTNVREQRFMRVEKFRASDSLPGLHAFSITADGLEVMYQSPVEVQLDKVAGELFRRVRDGKAKRVVIDALGDVRRASVDRQRFANMIYALMQWFAVENVTCMMTFEMSDLFEVHGISDEQISNMSDNVLLLRFQPGPAMKRTLRIIKTRGSAHDNREHEINITREGVRIEAFK